MSVTGRNQRWCARRLRAHGLRDLQRPAEVAAGQVIRPQRGQGREEIGLAQVCSGEFQATFEVRRGLRAGGSFRRRRQEPAAKAEPDFPPVPSPRRVPRARSARWRGSGTHGLRRARLGGGRHGLPGGAHLRPHRIVLRARNAGRPSASLDGPSRRRARRPPGCAECGARSAVAARRRPRAAADAENASCQCPLGSKTSAVSRSRTASSKSDSVMSRTLRRMSRSNSRPIVAAASTT